ncbi:MAG TPA: toll/interleukin-1 receptor domain-containing protein [Candidatus Tectomicrobia bacterium]|jgi:hypothetical protein
MGEHIFICYAREDESFVLRLATSLHARGVPVWLDQWHIKVGTDWDHSIDSALHDCAQFLIVLSPVAVASDEVRGELRTALDKKKPVVPVLRQACDIPRRLLLTQYVDFTGRSPDDAATLDRLVRALGLRTEPPPLPKPQPVRCASRRLWLYGTAGGVLVLGVLLGWLWPRQPTTPEPFASPLPPLSPVSVASTPAASPGTGKQDKPRLVPVHINTQPRGFDIYRGEQRVGTTPWQFDEPLGSHFKAVLKREGFKDEVISFRVNEHGNEYLYTPEKRGRR